MNANRVVNLLVEGIPITLGLHEQIFDFPLFFIDIGPPASVCVVSECTAEVIQSQIINLLLVTLEEAKSLPIVHMVELVLVAGSHQFYTVSNKVAVKSNKQTDKCQIIRWNEAIKVTFLLISERHIA